MSAQNLGQHHYNALLAISHGSHGRFSLPPELCDTHFLGSTRKITDLLYEDPNDKNITVKHTTQKELYNARGFKEDVKTYLTYSHKNADSTLENVDWVPEQVLEMFWISQQRLIHRLEYGN